MRTIFGMVAITKHPDFKPARVYLREWREHFSLTQEQIAERLDTDKSTISRLERSKRGLTNEWITAYAQGLGIRPEQFYRPPNNPSLDALLADASPELQRQILAITTTLLNSAAQH